MTLLNDVAPLPIELRSLIEPMSGEVGIAHQWGSRSIESDPIDSAIDSCPPPVWVIARQRHQRAGRQRIRIFAKVGSFDLGCENARTDPGAWVLYALGLTPLININHGASPNGPKN